MDDTAASAHGPGSVVRAVVLAVLVLVVVPAVVVNGFGFTVPAIALMLLAETVVAIFGLTYWLATVGTPAAWLSRHWRLTSDRFLIGAATAVGSIAAVGLVWFRVQLARGHSPLAQFDLRAAETAGRLSGERELMRTLDMPGVRFVLVLGGFLFAAALVARAFRSAALLASTVVLSSAIVELLKTSTPGSFYNFGAGAISWPSGHAALECSLGLGVVLWWWAAGLPRPSVVAAVVVPVAVLVGYSRAYLGIHLLSEVLAGWAVAAVAAAIVLVADRLLVSRFTVPVPPRRWPMVAAGVAAVFVIALSVHSVHHFHYRGPDNFPVSGRLPNRTYVR